MAAVCKPLNTYFDGVKPLRNRSRRLTGSTYSKFEVLGPDLLWISSSDDLSFNFRAPIIYGESKEFSFKVEAQSENARVGKIKTPRGTIDTPTFMPVGILEHRIAHVATRVINPHSEPKIQLQKLSRS